MIYDLNGKRKYLTKSERERFMQMATRQAGGVETFCLTLAYTGARISEVLALRASNVDMDAGLIVIESLKKRRRGVFRQIPVPSGLLHKLAIEHSLATAPLDAMLWRWSRTTAWKQVKMIMHEAEVPTFCSSPKGLRHSFGVVGVSEAQIPLNMMQKWLGHARIETTAIYANAVGSEERVIASRMWIS
ncbi:tyrosine-type recombinase/integrase [Sphingobium sp. AN641]|uniref:tyrosine-type recombinase/integrase n=1 Tax=Sphingobium sp. AN641 TaxID=3133443 RepID=UPI0030BE55A9